MPEWVADKRVFSLEEVGKSIQRTLEDRYKQSFWVKAEMNRLNRYAHSGHCYPELVQKKEGKVVAELRGILWKNDYERIQHSFVTTTREPLKDGIQILFLAQIQYDPLYGLSLKMLDIDPAYSLGLIEMEKMETIHKLKEEKLFFVNQGLAFSLVPKKLAIISVESSKGYSDFVKIIDGNPWGYKFEAKLFPALLQGDRAVPSIIQQLKRIQEKLNTTSNRFDVVLIIRGGGGEVGLSSYNHYDLAKEIASFPIPVMTGIGHSTNETVSEMVAYRSAITPSELADFLIQHFHAFALPLEKAEEMLSQRLPLRFEKEKHSLMQLANSCHRSSLSLLNFEKQVLTTFKWRIKPVSERSVQREKHVLETIGQSLKNVVPIQLGQKKMRLENLESQIRLLDPSNVLKRGYSITRFKGKAIVDTEQLKTGAEIETQVFSGILKSVVTSKESNQDPDR